MVKLIWNVVSQPCPNLSNFEHRIMNRARVRGKGTVRMTLTPPKVTPFHKTYHSANSFLLLSSSCENITFLFITGSNKLQQN